MFHPLTFKCVKFEFDQLDFKQCLMKLDVNVAGTWKSWWTDEMTVETGINYPHGNFGHQWPDILADSRNTLRRMSQYKKSHQVKAPITFFSKKEVVYLFVFQCS